MGVGDGCRAEELEKELEDLKVDMQDKLETISK